MPLTDTSSPVGSVPRTVTRLRYSGLSSDRHQAKLDTAFGCVQRRVDEGDRVLDDVGEHALQRGQLQHRDVVRRDLAAHLDGQPARDAGGERGEHAAELLRQRQARLDLFGDDAAGLHVDRVRHELALQREQHTARDGGARLVLRLCGRRTEVRRRDDVVEGEQRRVGARLGRSRRRGRRRRCGLLSTPARARARRAARHARR